MPVTPTYPGVYIEEIPSGVRTITGVATSITAFIGRTQRGPVNKAIRIQSFGDYARVFGGLWNDSTVSFAVNDFFRNGGTDAVIVRLHNSAVAATVDVNGLELEAATQGVSNPGDWANNLHAIIDVDVDPDAPANTFNLTLQLLDRPDATLGKVLSAETFRNISTEATSSPLRYRCPGAAVAVRPDDGRARSARRGRRDVWRYRRGIYRGRQRQCPGVDRLRRPARPAHA